MKRDRDAAGRALDRVLDEARVEALAELDWDRVEARLDQAPRFEELELEPSRGLRKSLFLAAAGLAVTIGWFTAGARAPIATPSAIDVPRQALDGNVLADGSRVEASVEDVAVEHAKHSRWTLERGGRATVTTSDGVVRVELERGSLVAEVVPSPRKETFVVEASGTRVAVHGTAFRVALVGERVDVSVKEGVVLVGPRDRPGSGRSMSANQSSSFTLAGALLDAERTATVRRSRPPADRREVPSAARPPELPLEPSIDEVERLVNQVFEVGAACFQSRTATANGVRVTANTTATLRVSPDGRLELAGLDPPLAPPVQSCFSEGIGKLSIGPSQRGIQIVRRMELER
jgi:ferric-dicitrate binding protein FerR (iron transport regulator)